MSEAVYAPMQWKLHKTLLVRHSVEGKYEVVSGVQQPAFWVNRLSRTVHRSGNVPGTRRGLTFVNVKQTVRGANAGALIHDTECETDWMQRVPAGSGATVCFLHGLSTNRRRGNRRGIRV